MAGARQPEQERLWADDRPTENTAPVTQDFKAPAMDVGQFDGSADPNPGGRMGMGWHLTLRDGREFGGAAEESPTPENTNNRAEYLALLALLEEYATVGGRGPLLVRGDSQLVISQMTGVWRVRNPALQGLNARAREAIGRIPGGVRFEWVPRHLNARADHLASGRPDATFGAQSSEPPMPIYARNPIRGIPEPLAGRIAALNAKGSASVKEYLALRVGGRDHCSEMRGNELRAAAGADCVHACAEAFPEDERSQMAALRWALRGLAVQHAIKKVQADQQIAASRSADQRGQGEQRR